MADTVRIGSLLFHHVLFLIMPDEDLRFAGGLYKIKGIIGLPVIMQFGEVQIKDDGHLFSPVESTPCSLHNLTLNGFTPFTEIEIFHQKHTYIFDMGAAASIFGTKFRAAYADSLQTGKEKQAGVGGAGGTQKIQILKAKNVSYKMGGNSGILSNAVIQLHGADDAFRSYFGIAGEDIFRNYKTMIINFREMYVLLK